MSEITDILKQAFLSRYTLSFLSGLISCSLFFVFYFSPLPTPSWAIKQWQISRWKKRREEWKKTREHWIVKIISSALMMGIVLLFFKDYLNSVYLGCFFFVFVIISALIANEPDWAAIIVLTCLILVGPLHFYSYFRLETFLLLIFLSLFSLPAFFFGLKFLYGRRWLLRFFFKDEEPQKKKK